MSVVSVSLDNKRPSQCKPRRGCRSGECLFAARARASLVSARRNCLHGTWTGLDTSHVQSWLIQWSPRPAMHRSEQCFFSDALLSCICLLLSSAGVSHATSGRFRRAPCCCCERQRRCRGDAAGTGDLDSACCGFLSPRRCCDLFFGFIAVFSLSRFVRAQALFTRDGEGRSLLQLACCSWPPHP